MIKEISPKVMELLVCSLCKGQLQYNKKTIELRCKPCKINYSVKDGVPNMIPKELM